MKTPILLKNKGCLIDGDHLLVYDIQHMMIQVIMSIIVWI